MLQFKNQVQDNSTRQLRVLDGIRRFIGMDAIRRDMVGSRLPFSSRTRTVSPVAVSVENSGKKKLTRFTFRV